MKIRILRGTVVGGIARVPGEVVETDRHTADYLVRLGKAERTAEATDARLVESATAEPPENTMQPKTARRKG